MASSDRAGSVRLRRTVSSKQRRTDESASLGATLSLLRIVKDRLSRLPPSEIAQDSSVSSDAEDMTLSRRASSQSTLVGTPEEKRRSRASISFSETESNATEDSMFAPGSEQPTDRDFESFTLQQLGDEREQDSGIDWKIANHGTFLPN
jgi:hypothetical protein